MILTYPVSSTRPILLMCVQDLVTDQRHIYPMLLDTGADRTCFPGSYAALIGHNNDHPAVVKTELYGLCGSSVAFMHSVKMGLLSPNADDLSTVPTAWVSRKAKAYFVEKLDSATGILGRDVMAEWKSVRFIPVGTKWRVEIEL